MSSNNPDVCGAKKKVPVIQPVPSVLFRNLINISLFYLADFHTVDL